MHPLPVGSRFLPYAMVSGTMRSLKPQGYSNMKLLAFIPIRLTLLLILGILIGRFIPIYPATLLLLTIALFLLLTVIYIVGKRTTTLLFGVVAALTVISLGAYSYTMAQPINNKDHYSTLDIGDNVLLHLKIREVLKPNQFSKRYFASVKSVDTHIATGKLLLYMPLDSIDLKVTVDDEIVVYSSLQTIQSPLNPHQFNYKEYLENLGVYHQIRIGQGELIKTRNPGKTLVGYAARARNHIIAKLKKENFGADELGVIQALLLGQRTDISEETYSNYQKAGAVHILALSGLHIGLLMALIQFLLRPLRYFPKGRTIILVVSVVLIWGFVFLAGLSASIIRATTMFTFVAYALYLNRPNNSFNILALSVLFILLFIDPNLLFQVGFQMSYTAVFAILALFPLLQKLWFPKNTLIRYFWQLLCVSVAAQIGVFPISLFYFHQFPGLFFVSNLLIIPALGIVLGIGVLVIFLALINSLPLQLIWLYNELIGLMNTSIALVAEQERFIFRSISFDFGQLLLSFMVILVFIRALRRFTFKRIATLLVSLIIFQGWTFHQEFDANEKEELIILHQTKNSILSHKKGRALSVLTNDQNKAMRLVQEYQIGERIKTTRYEFLANSYTVQDSSLLIIDSTGVYPAGNRIPSILLTQSPKINLDRLIEDTRPIEIIADGSNYRSYIDRWRSTCLKHKIPFHFTGEKGAYYFSTVLE